METKRWKIGCTICTIPRLELQAAVIGSRLGKTIQQESRFEFERLRYLTESRVALAWIQGQTCNYKPFVSSKVAEIQNNSEPAHWSHCPTDVNVADDITKRISVEEINVRWSPCTRSRILATCRRAMAYPK